MSSSPQVIESIQASSAPLTPSPMIMKQHQKVPGSKAAAVANLSASSSSSSFHQGEHKISAHLSSVAPITNGEEVLAYFNPRDALTQEQTLDKYFRGVVNHFLSETKVHNNAPDEKTLKEKFSNPSVPQEPTDLSSYFLKLVQNSVMETTHCHSPKMIGHMTSSLPFFHRPLAHLVTAMNQNTVKIETSSMVTFLERETLAKLHKSFFEKETSFYQFNIHSPDACLGCITSGGTLANLTALWVARNMALGPKGEFSGVEKEGLFRALKYHGYEDAVILGSQMMHYSFKKATDILGLGISGLVTIPYDEKFRVRLDLMEQTLIDCQRRKVLVLAVVGVAGTTESGSFDDLQGLASLCQKYKVHFHVDAAWGGPLIFSNTHKVKLAGINQADSITVDGHKQLYTPMGCGIVLFKDPSIAKSIRKTANYIIRKESLDVGKFSPEGSRPASAIYLHACLSLIGVKGYKTLVDRSCSLVTYMANKIKDQPDFEIVAEPSSNIMLYRWIPAGLREKRKAKTLSKEDNEQINQRNMELQNMICKEAESFVSRTTVFSPKYEMGIVGLRVVIANPNTTREHIDQALEEQRKFIKKLCP